MSISLSKQGSYGYTCGDAVKIVILFMPLISWLVIFRLAGMVPIEERRSPNVSFLPKSDHAITGTYLLYRDLPHNLFLTVVCSLPYLIHFLLPFLTTVALLIGVQGECVETKIRCNRCKKRDFVAWIFIFGCVNLAGVCVQSVFPTAPPWWYSDTLLLEETNSTSTTDDDMGSEQGVLPTVVSISVENRVEQIKDTREDFFQSEELVAIDSQDAYSQKVIYLMNSKADYSTLPSESRLVESDKALGMGLFASIYGQSPIVFGSFPSLHATWPIVCCIPFIAIKGWKFAPYAIVYWLWIWFAAIYLKHHFLTDILGAIFIAALAFVLKCIVFRTMNIPNKIYFQCSDCTFDTFTYKMKKTRNYKDITLDSNIYWTENTEYSVAL